MNYETVCVKIKLKPNSLERVREWAETMNARKDEALATLRDETVIVEAVFLDQTGEGDFLVTFMKAESLKKPVKPSKNRFMTSTSFTKHSNRKPGKRENRWNF